MNIICYNLNKVETHYFEVPVNFRKFNNTYTTIDILV